MVLIKCLWDPESAQGLARSRHLQSPLDNSLAIVPSSFWDLKTIRHQGPEMLGPGGQSSLAYNEG